MPLTACEILLGFHGEKEMFIYKFVFTPSFDLKCRGEESGIGMGMCYHGNSGGG